MCECKRDTQRQSACVFEQTNGVYGDFFVCFFSYVCTYYMLCVFTLCSLAAEFPKSIRLHWGLIVFLLGLRDGLL